LIAEETDDDSQIFLKEIFVSLDWSFVRVFFAGLLKCQAQRSGGEHEGQKVEKREQDVNGVRVLVPGLFHGQAPQNGGEREGQEVEKRKKQLDGGDSCCYFAMLPQDTPHTSPILASIIRMAWFSM